MLERVRKTSLNGDLYPGGLVTLLGDGGSHFGIVIANYEIDYVYVLWASEQGTMREQILRQFRKNMQELTMTL